MCTPCCTRETAGRSEKGDFGRGAVDSDAGASRDQRLKNLFGASCFVTDFIEDKVTSAAQTASLTRGSNCIRPQAACRLCGRRALRIPAQAQAITTMAQRHRLAPSSHQKRTPAVEPPPWRRGLRHPNAATTARGLRPPFRLFPRAIRPLTAYWAVNIAHGSRKFARKLARPPDFVRGR